MAHNVTFSISARTLASRDRPAAVGCEAEEARRYESAGFEARIALLLGNHILSVAICTVKCLSRHLRSSLVRAAGEEAAITILHDKFARLPGSVAKGPRELDSPRDILGVEGVRVLDEQVGVERPCYRDSSRSGSTGLPVRLLEIRASASLTLSCVGTASANGSGGWTAFGVWRERSRVCRQGLAVKDDANDSICCRTSPGLLMIRWWVPESSTTRPRSANASNHFSWFRTRSRVKR